MSVIRVLDKHVAELIAAGEVVERPASVIKELVENSIDAGASAITVEIKHGGTLSMRVTDNGCGISREDVPRAFLRHATSKVKEAVDLDAISTLGFRGEALASIAAVARVELLTRTRDELAGTRYCIEGGEETAFEDAGCPQGTTIVVEDIFYNTPARMKFLKKDIVEANAVAGILDKVALSHPEISFRLIRDGKETLHTPGDGKLKAAIHAVCGKEFTSSLIPVDYQYSGVTVTGFVTKPSAARPNRSMQQFFINGRYVKSKTATVALEQAFKGTLMVGKFPGCVLHMTISCEAVDVNVHPSKLEIRFINEKPVFDTVYYGVKSALQAGDSPIEMSFGRTQPQPFSVPRQEESKREWKPTPVAHRMEQGFSVSKPSNIQKEKTVPVFKAAPWTIPQAKRPIAVYDSGILDIQVEEEEEKKKECLKEHPVGKNIDLPQPNPAKQPEKLSADIPQIKDRLPIKEELSQAEKVEQWEDWKVAGELFDTYVLVQRKDSVWFIDKHAAHERLLYEKLKAEHAQAYSQMLLQPRAVMLEKNEYAAVLEHLDLFQQAGFEVENFGDGTVLVRSAPLSLEGEDVAASVLEIAGYLASSKTDITTEHLDRLITTLLAARRSRREIKVR